MCWIIAVVCILDHSYCTFFKLLTFSYTECNDSINRIDVAGYRCQYHCTHFYVVSSHAAFSRSWLGSMWCPRQEYM